MRELTDQNFREEVYKSNVPVLIEFYRDGCDPCRKLEPICEKLAQEYPGIKFVKANLSSGEIASLYEVKNAPFFVLVNDGKLIKRFPGLTGRVGGQLEAISGDYIKRQIGSYANPDATENLEDKLKFSDNALRVLERRYLKRDENGNVMETPKQLLERVALSIAFADRRYGKSEEEISQLNKEFYQMMANQDFMPNSPTLMNAGKGEGQLSACFVLPIEDDMRSIAYTVGNTAMIHKSGGGTGFDFSRLRPENDFVSTTYGRASGPISFADSTDRMTEAVNQGGFRRGANMGILRVDHPDIEKFIRAKDELDLKNKDVYNKFRKRLDQLDLDEPKKEQIMEHVKKSLSEKQLNNFNISVALTDEFMQAVKEDREYNLINPRNGKVVKRERATRIFNLIAEYAWRNGEPGVVFIDRINEDNPTPALGRIESTNPCGEQPLLPYEACNLGSMNLGNFVCDGKIDYERLSGVIKKAVHFLDNVIDVSEFPKVLHVDLKNNSITLENKIREMVNANRKIGMGVMGFADMLIKLGIPYDSEEALQKAEEVMEFIRNKGREASVELANERGEFPNFKQSIFDRESKYYKGTDVKLRNATITTIAPTGSISLIADCSSGIESLYAVAFTRTVMDRTPLKYIHPKLEEILRKEGCYSEELMEKIKRKELSLKDIEGIPDKVKRLFKTALDISVEDHVKMQAVFQKHTDNAVSKTINFPNSATIEDVKKAYLLAYELGCKGITVYRDGSRDEQVLTTASTRKTKEQILEELVAEDHEKIERPKVTVGPMIKIPLGKDLFGKDRSAFIYLGANEKGRLVEGFVITGKSGGDITAHNEALGRSISRMLQRGEEPEPIIEMYENIRGGSPGYEEDVIIHSSPDGVAKVLGRYLDGKYSDYLKKAVEAYELRYGNGKRKEKVTGAKEVQEIKEVKTSNPKPKMEKTPCPGCKSTDYSVINEEGCVYLSCCRYSLHGCE